MAKKEDYSQENSLEKIEETLSKTERFIENNQKTIVVVTAVLVFIIGGYWAFKSFYVAPKEIEAQKEMYIAQYYFEKDSFALALNGDGQYLGFAEIAEDYGITKSGNLSSYYAGLCNLHLGNYEEAISNLEDFSTDDVFVGAVSLGALGDANMELNNLDKALSYYKKAAEYNKNELMSPYFYMKAAFASEQINNYADALKYYTIIKEEYPKSQQAGDIEKYIARAEIKK